MKVRKYHRVELSREAGKKGFLSVGRTFYVGC
jgi:hypothetical protein